MRFLGVCIAKPSCAPRGRVSPRASLADACLASMADSCRQICTRCGSRCSLPVSRKSSCSTISPARAAPGCRGGGTKEPAGKASGAWRSRRQGGVLSVSGVRRTGHRDWPDDCCRRVPGRYPWLLSRIPREGAAPGQSIDSPSLPCRLPQGKLMTPVGGPLVARFCRAVSSASPR